ncbi:MAG: hypothetical protein FJX75_25525 [Armatimonadetes bacterium]|nr:hypothetical protein [Armatimonadota bacterium]
MRRGLGVVVLLGVGLVAVSLLSGCSGPGAPGVWPGVRDLRTLADDHLSAWLLVRSWFSILHVKEPVSGAGTERKGAVCEVMVEDLPLLPGDPAGTVRMRGRTSDCLTWEAVMWPDGSGEQIYRRDSQESHMTWGAPRMQGPWQIVDIDQTTWDGARLVYESAYNLESPNSDQYYKGRATLADGREMDFEHDRNNDLDQLTLSLPDASVLQIKVPLTVAVGAPYWPRFTQGADGTFRGPTGLEQHLRLTGSGNERWDRWELRAPQGMVGMFTLAEDFTGRGQLSRSGEVLGALRWQETPERGILGVLEPVGSRAIETTPSAAARDFRIDRWIGNIAALGPMPMY